VAFSGVKDMYIYVYTWCTVGLGRIPLSLDVSTSGVGTVQYRRSNGRSVADTEPRSVVMEVAS